METFYTYNEDLNTIQMYSREDIKDRVNDYKVNFEDGEFLIEDISKYSYRDIAQALGNTYSAEKLFLVTDSNNQVLYKTNTL